MATQAPVHTTESGLAEASAALSSALAGGSPAPPAAEPGPTPSAPAAAPQPSEPPTGSGPAVAAPAQPAPASGAPATPVADPFADIADPAARRYLEMHGGNREQALAKALQYNNRLAQLHREHPELFQPGGAADPSRVTDPAEAVLFREPPPVTPSLPSVEVDPSVIRARVDEAVLHDPESTTLVREFMGNQQQLLQINNQKHDLQESISYESRKLADPEFSPEDLRRPEIENKIFRMQSQLGLLEQRESRADLANERISARFDQRRALIDQYMTNQIVQQAEEQAFTAYEQQLENTEYRKTLVEWPSALDRCIKENSIPPEQVEDFKADAVRAFQAAMSDPSRVIDDMYAFLSPVAKGLVARLDRYHRVRAGQYAQGAATRAATPSPATGPGTPGAPATARFPTPEEAMAEATRYYRQRVRG